MSWWIQLGKDSRGSRPRCVLLVDGSREEVADRLTNLVNLPGIVVSPDDRWMPYGKPVRENGSWDAKPAKEAELDEADDLICRAVRQELQRWWLAKSARTPNWDIASTCEIEGVPGLLLVEAKAHGKELSESDTCSSTYPANREQIRRAIVEAASGLESVTGTPWAISRDHHYQLSNRFSWSWKLASLGIPVVLVYLGFLNAQDMVDRSSPFQSEDEWDRTLREYCKDVVDEGCWGNRLDITGTPLLPLIRAVDQPFVRD